MKRALEHVHYEGGMVRLGSVVEDDHPSVAHGRFEDLPADWQPRRTGSLIPPSSTSVDDYTPSAILSFPGELLESTGYPLWVTPVAAFLGGLLGAVLGSLL